MASTGFRWGILHENIHLMLDFDESSIRAWAVIYFLDSRKTTWKNCNKKDIVFGGDFNLIFNGKFDALEETRY